MVEEKGVGWKGNELKRRYEIDWKEGVIDSERNEKREGERERERERESDTYTHIYIERERQRKREVKGITINGGKSRKRQTKNKRIMGDMYSIRSCGWKKS